MIINNLLLLSKHNKATIDHSTLDFSDIPSIPLLPYIPTITLISVIIGILLNAYLIDATKMYQPDSLVFTKKIEKLTYCKLAIIFSVILIILHYFGFTLNIYHIFLCQGITLISSVVVRRKVFNWFTTRKNTFEMIQQSCKMYLIILLYYTVLGCGTLKYRTDASFPVLVKWVVVLLFASMLLPKIWYTIDSIFIYSSILSKSKRGSIHINIVSFYSIIVLYFHMGYVITMEHWANYYFADNIIVASYIGAIMCLCSTSIMNSYFILNTNSASKDYIVPKYDNFNCFLNSAIRIINCYEANRNDDRIGSSIE